MAELPHDNSLPRAGLPRPAKGRERIHWRQVGILYRREMRAALREKTIVINSILMPILLYPLLLWGVFTGLMFVQGQTEGVQSRVAICSWPKDHPGLRLKLQRQEQLNLIELPALGDTESAKIKAGDLDALLEFLPATNTGVSLPGNFHARLTFNRSKERSEKARDRLVSALDDYRGLWLRREAGKHGLEAAEWRIFSLTTQNLASDKQMGAFVLGLMLPLMFVVMVAVGCFYPAVDSTAGERERHTWETLMSTAASRTSIVTAKYLYVTTLGGLAGLLNLIAMTLSIKPIFGPILSKTGGNLEYTWSAEALPVMLLAAVLLAGFVAAGMMLFASFARTFKEGQAMITPFYMLIMVPIMFLQAPGLKLTLALALLPIVNVTMVVREAVSGTFQWSLIGITTVVSLVLIAGALGLATLVLRFEDVVLGSFSGSLIKFLKERLLRRRVAPRAMEVRP